MTEFRSKKKSYPKKFLSKKNLNPFLKNLKH